MSATEKSLGGGGLHSVRELKGRGGVGRVNCSNGRWKSTVFFLSAQHTRMFPATRDEGAVKRFCIGALGSQPTKAEIRLGLDGLRYANAKW